MFCGAALEAGNLLSAEERDVMVGGGCPGGGGTSVINETELTTVADDMVSYNVLLGTSTLQPLDKPNPVYEEKKV